MSRSRPRAPRRTSTTRRQARNQRTSPNLGVMLIAAAVVGLGVMPMLAFAQEPESTESPAPAESPTGLPVLEETPLPSSDPSTTPDPQASDEPEEETPSPTETQSPGALGQDRRGVAQLKAALRRAAQLQAELPDPTLDVSQLEQAGLELGPDVSVSVVSISRGDSFCMVAHHEDLPSAFYFMDDERDEPGLEQCI